GRAFDHPGGDRLDHASSSGGVELLRAWFAGRGFTKHRHDTYAIGVTDAGVQLFDYRGATRTSLPGEVVVLHPDEAHDGRAGSAEGLGSGIVPLARSRVAEAARAIYEAPMPLPFVNAVVSSNATLAAAIDEAFLGFPAAPEPLALDALIEAMTRGLVAADRSL